MHLPFGIHICIVKKIDKNTDLNSSVFPLHRFTNVIDENRCCFKKNKLRIEYFATEDDQDFHFRILSNLYQYSN